MTEAAYIATLTRNPETVARAFAHALSKNVGDRAYACIIRTNTRKHEFGFACCASHDFVDANDVMTHALAHVGIPSQLPPDAEEGTPEADAYADREAALTGLINAAWTAWRANPITLLTTR
jgi:hypothetical protein